MWQRGRCVLRHASSCCRACSSSWGNDDELLSFINRSSLPSSGRPIDSSSTAYIKLSSLAANSPMFGLEFERRLEEVYVPSGGLIDTAQRRGCRKPLQAT